MSRERWQPVHNTLTVAAALVSGAVTVFLVLAVLWAAAVLGGVQ